jgi:uncharacterized protein YcaQ
MPKLPKLSLSAVRALALHVQQLTLPLDGAPKPTVNQIYEVVEHLGCVQIDTLQMVHRSQYIVLWSRLGTYQPADFDKLVYDPQQRRLFEYWQHAASLIPLRDFRYRLPTMRWFREGTTSRYGLWKTDPKNAALVAAVMERVQREGAVRAADFEHDGSKRGTWWDWKPAKRALEYLYNNGELMIAGRKNFQRVYDLPKRVLPAWVDTSEPTEDEANRQRVEQAVKGLGICEPLHAAEYAYLKRGTAKPVIEALTKEGVFVSVQGETASGEKRSLIVHGDHLPLVKQAVDGALPAQRTTFLSPFDNLFWARGRDVLFWNFRHVLEAYKPGHQREWGYFCLPILHRDRLVGRFDPKLERKTGTLRLKALHLEPGVQPDERLIADVAGALRDFLAFHHAQHVIIERSIPAEFGDKLTQAL